MFLYLTVFSWISVVTWDPCCLFENDIHSGFQFILLNLLNYKIHLTNPYAQYSLIKLNWCRNAWQVYFKTKDFSPIEASLLQMWTYYLVSVAPEVVSWIRKSIVTQTELPCRGFVSGWGKWLQLRGTGGVGDWAVVTRRGLWLTTLWCGELSLQWWADAQLQRLHGDERKWALRRSAALPLRGWGGEERPLDPDSRVPGRAPGEKRTAHASFPYSGISSTLKADGTWTSFPLALFYFYNTFSVNSTVRRWQWYRY